MAGGARVNGTFSAIIVEPMGEATTEDYSTLIASNLTIALGIDEITEFEEITFAGQDARTFNTDAYVEGVPFHYRFITFIYKGFGYQLVSWHTKTPGKTKDPGLAEFTDCFSLLPGQPTLPPVEALPDNVAQAGRLKDGRFESGVFKFALSPTRNWRVMAGPSLQNMSAEARAGLEGGPTQASLTHHTPAERLGSTVPYTS